MIRMDENRFTEVFNGLMNRIVWEVENKRSADEIKHTVEVLGKTIERHLKKEDITTAIKEIEDLSISF